MSWVAWAEGRGGRGEEPTGLTAGYWLSAGEKGWAGLGWIERARLDRVLGWSLGLGSLWAGLGF